MKFYKKIFTIVSISLLTFFVGTSLVFAESSENNIATTTSAACSSYYHFQSVEVSMGLPQDSYSAGSAMTFSGVVRNENNYPIVDGNVFVRIAKVNPNYTSEGHYIVDEIIPITGLALDANEVRKVSFTWVAPTTLTSGEYRADYFYSVGKKFNMGGLPFSNEVIIGSTSFSIISAKNGGLSFNRAGTTINEKEYRQIGNWLTVEDGKPAVIKQILKNSSAESVQASISYDLYFWDSLNVADKINSKNETVTIPARGSVTLIYTVPNAQETVYYLKITAAASGEKSVINVRFVTGGERPRLNYPAITDFPLTEGVSATLFSCFHNTSGVNTFGTVLVTLTDKKDKVVGELNYSGEILSQMSAVKSEILPKRDYSYLKLSARVLDRNGKEVDKYSTTYDCSVLRSPRCLELLASEKENAIPWSIVKIILGVVIIIIALLWRRKMNRNVIVGTMVLCAVLFGGYSSAEASNQQTATSYSPYVFGWNRLSAGGSCDDQPNRLVAFGDISVLHKVDITTGSDSIKVGDPVNFAYNPDAPFFNAYGGSWDTPYGEWYTGNISVSKIKSKGQAIASDIGGNEGYIYWTGTKPTGTYITSSAPSVVSCDGMNCTGVSVGTATLTAHVPETKVRIWAYIYLNGQFEWLSDTAPYLKSGYRFDECDVAPKTNTLTLPANTSMSWTVSVAGSPGPGDTEPPVSELLPTGQLACGTTAVNLTWTAVSGASYYNLRVNDKTNEWSGKCTAADPANPGDLCWDGYVGTSLSNFAVSAGHEYDFWVDASVNTSRSTSFSVPTAEYCLSIEGTCTDGIKNGNETGIDIGGRCIVPNSGTCTDGIKNGDETGIDTGGRCVYGIGGEGTCTDRIQNGNETSVDVGGRCGSGANGSCFDGIKNGDETGIDTGGRCTISLGTCFDGIKNGDETSVDTGGRCAPTQCPTACLSGRPMNSCGMYYGGGSCTLNSNGTCSYSPAGAPPESYCGDGGDGETSNSIKFFADSLYASPCSLHWTATGFDQCYLSGKVGSTTPSYRIPVGISGATTTVEITIPSSYTLECSSGEIISSAVLVCRPPGSIGEF